MKIKRTLRFHLTQSEQLRSKATNDKCWRDFGERETLLYFPESTVLNHGHSLDQILSLLSYLQEIEIF